MAGIRDVKKEVKYTKSEYELVKERAEKMTLTPSAYIRWASLTIAIPEARVTGGL